MINSLKTLFLVLMFTGISVIGINAQQLSILELEREGARIGRQFKVAVEKGDVDAQNAALNDIDAILATLKTQEQVDALVNAFNNCNVTISTPSHDAMSYTMALGVAMADNDEIGIEDALDIIENVRQQYRARSDKEYDEFEWCLIAARSGLDLGLKAFDADGNADILQQIETQVDQLRQKYATDSTSLNIVNEMYGIFSVKITDIDNDARICADKIINALSRNNNKNNAILDKALNEVGYYYKKYALQFGEDKAKQLNEKINMKLGGKYNL